LPDAYSAASHTIHQQVSFATFFAQFVLSFYTSYCQLIVWQNSEAEVVIIHDDVWCSVIAEVGFHLLTFIRRVNFSDLEGRYCGP
jgi:hypothetical protein